MTPHKHQKEIIAWANGAEIEFFNIPSKSWAESKDPVWSINNRYRIKPETKIIPFDFLDAENILGKTVKHKEGLHCVAVLIECNLTSVFIGNTEENYDILLQDYTFLDGSPCGKVSE